MSRTAKVWNRTEAINGADPDAILAGLPEGLPEDAPVLLIGDGDVVEQIQPNDPRKPGWVWWADEQEALSYGDDVIAGVTVPEPGDPVGPPVVPPAPPTAEEFAQLRADLDWVINFAVTGEA